MNRRNFLKTIGLGAAHLALTGCASVPFFSNRESAGDRPNILLIMFDDMGFSDLGCYGGEIETPNLNALAANGLRFTQFYNNCVCCPTRASLLTGLYPHQAGMGGMVNHGSDIYPPGPYQGYLNEKCVTIAEVLKSAGYSTYLSGKWHVGESRPHWPTDRGFDKYFGLISGAANYFDIDRHGGRVRTMALDDQPWKPPKEGFYMTDAIADKAVEYLRFHDQKENPFFMYVAFTAPHWPLHAPAETIAKYKGKYLEGPGKLRSERYKRLIENAIIDEDLRMSPVDAESADWSALTDEQKQDMDLRMAVYAAQIDRADQGVGRIIDQLKEMGRGKNTLVLFLSDNGGSAEGGPLGFDRRNNGLPPGGVDSYMSYGLSWANASNTPFRRYKTWVHEGGISTPLIANWPPVIKRNTITNQPGHLIDIMATCLDVAGVDYPKQFNARDITPLEGRSLLPIFEGKTRTPNSPIFWEFQRNRAVRAGKWKLVTTQKGKWELYNLESDRTELNNLAETHPEKVKELRYRYTAWARKTGAKI